MGVGPGAGRVEALEVEVGKVGKVRGAGAARAGTAMGAAARAREAAATGAAEGRGRGGGVATGARGLVG